MLSMYLRQYHVTWTYIHAYMFRQVLACTIMAIIYTECMSYWKHTYIIWNFNTLYSSHYIKYYTHLILWHVSDVTMQMHVGEFVLFWPAFKYGACWLFSMHATLALLKCCVKTTLRCQAGTFGNMVYYCWLSLLLQMSESMKHTCNALWISKHW